MSIIPLIFILAVYLIIAACAPAPETTFSPEPLTIVATTITLATDAPSESSLTTQPTNSPLPIPSSPTTAIALTAASTPMPRPSPTAGRATLPDSESIDILDSSAVIKVPFVRDGAIYLYEDGVEKLVAKPAQQTTQQACFNLVYPFLSPDKKYLAYIEQTGEPPNEVLGCLAGILRIVDISTGITKSTSDVIIAYRWTSTNLLNFFPFPEIDQNAQSYIVRNVYFEPSSQTETVFETVIGRDPSSGAETLLSAEFPSDNLSKLIRYSDNSYSLVDNTSNEENFLFDDTQVTSFFGWSPGGRYAIFESVKKPLGDFEVIEFVVDTQNPGAGTIEITVGRGAAGGDFPVGRKWYYEKGFVAYCREELYFVDGSPPLPLTNDPGGGCHNEEGFVATSPNGEYAVLKFQDRFELHTRDGNVTAINELEPIAKGRGVPKNFIWANDDYMIIFESTHRGGFGTIDGPKVFLFDRQANLIKTLIENAYLLETSP
jgi:hypothetical protein